MAFKMKGSPMQRNYGIGTPNKKHEFSHKTDTPKEIQSKQVGQLISDKKHDENILAKRKNLAKEVATEQSKTNYMSPGVADMHLQASGLFDPADWDSTGERKTSDSNVADTIDPRFAGPKKELKTPNKKRSDRLTKRANKQRAKAGEYVADFSKKGEKKYTKHQDKYAKLKAKASTAKDKENK